MHSNNDISKSSLSFFKWNFNKQKVWLREADAQLALAGPAVVTNVTFLCLFVWMTSYRDLFGKNCYIVTAHNTIFSWSFSNATSASEEKPSATMNQNQSPNLTSTVSMPENKTHRSRKKPILSVDIFAEDIPSSSSRFLEDDTEELPSMLDSSANKPEKEELFHCGNYELSPSPAKKASSISLVECPICSMFFPLTKIEIHAALCNNKTDVSQTNTTLEDDHIPCPICSKLFPLAWIEQHADVCVETSRSNDSNNMGREVITSQGILLWVNR